MCAVLTYMAAQQRQHVWILMVAMSVHVTLGTLETELLVQVNGQVHTTVRNITWNHIICRY